MINQTPLFCAADRSCTNAVQLLLAHKDTNLALVYRNGYTPLHLTPQTGLVEMMKEALKRNTFDMNSEDQIGNTPLHYTILRNHLDCVKILLEAENFNVNSRPRFGQIPLHLAVQYGNVACVKALLSVSSIDVNIEDSLRLNALYYTTWLDTPNKEELFALLIQCGAKEPRFPYYHISTI